jgi:hypothetical protein
MKGGGWGGDVRELRRSRTFSARVRKHSKNVPTLAGGATATAGGVDLPFNFGVRGVFAFSSPVLKLAALAIGQGSEQNIR